jgi:hypothetical protein
VPSIVPIPPDTQDDDGPDALDSLPLAVLLHSRLASWFGDDRQSFLVADLVPVVTQIIAEYQHAALEMARKADIAESRAEEAEYHVEQLRDARDSAERRLERAERLIDSWEHDAPDHSNPVFIGRLRECLRRAPASVRLRGEGCDHDWLDRPESDTRECLLCGAEVAG